MKCPNCGIPVDRGDSFCRNCGLPLPSAQRESSRSEGVVQPPPPPPHPSNVPPGSGYAYGGHQGGQYAYNSSYPYYNGYRYYGYSPARETNTKAIISLGLGISSFFIPFIGAFLGLVAIIMGIMARREIKMDPNQDGNGFAMAGIILGIFSLLFSTLILFIFFLPLLLIGSLNNFIVLGFGL